MACIVQLVIATFFISVIFLKRGDSKNVNKKTSLAAGRVGEILQFWEPDPRFKTSRAPIRRFNKNNQKTKFRYDKGEKNPYNLLLSSSSESNSADHVYRAVPAVKARADGNLERRAQATAKTTKATKTAKTAKTTKATKNHPSTRITAMGLKDNDPETTKPAPDKPENKNQFDDPNQPNEPDDYDNNFVLSVYEIADQYKKLLLDYPSANVSSEVIARTASYNDVWLFRISGTNSNQYFRTGDNKYMQEVPEKKIVFIVHALSSMGLGKLYSLTVEKYLKKLLAFYLSHLDKFDIFLIPMANPDGYIKVKQIGGALTDSNPNLEMLALVDTNASISKLGLESGDKKPEVFVLYFAFDIWNKNTSPQPDCYGVALDRNFDVAWNNSRKVSSCSQHFPGPRPFSEPESAAVADIFHKYSHKIIAYFHVHAGQYDLTTFRITLIYFERYIVPTFIQGIRQLTYVATARRLRSSYEDIWIDEGFNKKLISSIFQGDAILYPRGFTDVQTSDDDKYIDLRAEVEDAMKNANFKTLSVTVDSLYNWYGKISGSSVDYAAAVYGIPNAMELVMQLYQDPVALNNLRMSLADIEEMEYYALTEIWRRLINVIFMNIWRKLTGIEQATQEVDVEPEVDIDD